ncbi:MAG: hypothetical protein FWD97_08350 [Defluviitaleaceae bacterium]|nr:hypothetical protein [Defluviitaleaceae bacterium]
MKITITAILITILLLFFACNYRKEPEALVNLDKMNFAFHTQIFDFQMVIDGEIETRLAAVRAWNATNPDGPEFNPFYTELIFVHNQSEAKGFSDNIIVAWPADRPIAQIMVDRMNVITNRTSEELGNGRNPIDLEDFGLAYPITIMDLVDNWESVLAVWMTFTEDERMSVRP